MADPSQETTHFGFEDVPVAEKASRVRGVFNSVADQYDVMNDAMSAGIHRLWKDYLIQTLNPRRPMHLLDVAGGTGDIAFRFLDACQGGQVTVADINAEMLRVGKDRAAAKGYDKRCDFICGDAMALPVADASVDAYTISFGLRNVTHIDRAIRDALRVLKPGGRLLILEFSPQVIPLLQKAYDAYSFTVIPALGSLITGDRASYQYLAESIRKFPTKEKLADMIAAEGFDHVSFKTLSAGVVAIHSGVKI